MRSVSKAGCLIAVLIGLIAGVLLIALLRSCSPAQAPAVTAAPAASEAPTDAELTQGSAPAVHDLTFSRLSDTEICLTWPDDLDGQAERYAVLRRDAAGKDRWTEIGSVDADGAVSGEPRSFTDVLDSAEPRQFFYRIDAVLPRQSGGTAAAGDAVLASNRSVCIDPGHYLRQFSHMSWTIGVYNVTAHKNAYSVFFDGKKSYLLSVFAYPIPYINLNLKF